MKYINKITLFALAFIFFAACKKNEAEITYSGGGTPPVLSASVPNNSVLVLSPADSTNPTITFSWTNPNYTFSNGISSLDVNYTLEIDTVGSNFTNPKLVQITIASDLTTSFTVGNLNTQLFGFLTLQTGVPHNIAMRVVSFLNAGSLPLYSNVITYTITPYAIPPAVAPPSSGVLYLTGSATPDGWMVGGTASTVTSPVNQQMTVVPGSNGLIFTLTLPMIGGQSFLVVPVAGDWTNKYATSDANSPLTGDSFEYNAANNFNGPASSGTYTVTFNFQTGVYTITQ
jgi:starch-binding outer membrane protein SusE/F